MKALKEVLTALRREFAEMAPSERHGIELVARRVSIDLELVINEQPTISAPAFFVATNTAAPGGSTDGPRHRLTIEFELEATGTTLRETPLRGELKTIDAASKPGAGGLREQLQVMFGSPGFDNAARATVFCEILEGLGSSQIAQLLQSFEKDHGEVPVVKPEDSTVAMARTRISRALKLAPNGFAPAVAAMLGAFRTHDVPTILLVLREQWKTQGDWIDTVVPGVNFTGPRPED